LRLNGKTAAIARQDTDQTTLELRQIKDKLAAAQVPANLLALLVLAHAVVSLRRKSGTVTRRLGSLAKEGNFAGVPSKWPHHNAQSEKKRSESKWTVSASSARKLNIRRPIPLHYLSP
jgi:hypothetical protein